MQAAFNAATANGQELFVPVGRYRLTRRIVARGDFTLVGESRQKSQLVWDNGVPAGIRVEVINAGGYATIADISKLSFVSKSTVNQGNAVEIQGEPSVNGDRVTQRAVIRDVIVRGDQNPTIDGFARGLLLRNLTNVLVDSFNFTGRVLNGAGASYGSLNAIAYLGEGQFPHHCALTVSNSYIAYAQTGIYADDFEGVLVQTCQIMGTNIGVLFTGPNTYPHASIQNTHINASNVPVIVDKVYEVFVQGSLLYCELNNGVIGAGIIVRNGSKYVLLSGNVIENLKTDQAINGVIVENGTHVMISNNIFRRTNRVNGSGGLAIWLTPNSAWCRVNDNIIDDTAQVVLNQGTGNTIV